MTYPANPHAPMTREYRDWQRDARAERDRSYRRAVARARAVAERDHARGHDLMRRAMHDHYLR